MKLNQKQKNVMFNDSTHLLKEVFAEVIQDWSKFDYLEYTYDRNSALRFLRDEVGSINEVKRIINEHKFS